MSAFRTQRASGTFRQVQTWLSRPVTARNGANTLMPGQKGRTSTVAQRAWASTAPTTTTKPAQPTARPYQRAWVSTAPVNSSKPAEQATQPSQSTPTSTGIEGENNGGASLDIENGNGNGPTDWSKSYHGLSTQAFSKEIAEVLLAPIDPEDIECKPDGLIYLPEIKYRRILNKAFGPGAWGLAPRSETNVGPKIVSREYALVCQGRLVAIARGEQEYFDPSGIPTATEACKSNALMRCSKDLGIASELWDPRFIRQFKSKYCMEVFAEHLSTKRKKKLWRRKDAPKFEYPYQE